MARQTINTGVIANDGSGDTLRSAGIKINQNFTELYGLVGGGGATTTALTDSGLDIIGSAFRTKIGAVNPASELRIDFPDSTGVLTLNTGTQTLTNKTIDSAQINNPEILGMRIYDSSSREFFYQLLPGDLSANATLNIPAVSDSDDIVLSKAIQTLTDKTFITPNNERPKIRGWLGDSTNQPVISFSDTGYGTTRNRIKVVGSAAGSEPVISSIGNDTNINLFVNAKGTGHVRINKYAASTETKSAGGTVSGTASILILTGGAGTVTLPAAPDTGAILHVIRQAGAGQITLGISDFLQGSTGVLFDQYDTATLVFDGTNWYVTGGNGYTIS